MSRPLAAGPVAVGPSNINVDRTVRRHFLHSRTTRVSAKCVTIRRAHCVMCEKATYGYDFKYDGLGLRTLPSDETFGIGSDPRMPMDDQDYQMPSAFIGKLNKLTFAIGPPVLTD